MRHLGHGAYQHLTFDRLCGGGKERADIFLDPGHQCCRGRLSDGFIREQRNCDDRIIGAGDQIVTLEGRPFFSSPAAPRPRREFAGHPGFDFTASDRSEQFFRHCSPFVHFSRRARSPCR